LLFGVFVTVLASGHRLAAMAGGLDSGQECDRRAALWTAALRAPDGDEPYERIF